jgi:AraC-like DNA-binding protein
MKKKGRKEPAMYEFELNFGPDRIHMRKEEDPNETKHEWDSISHNHAGFELHVLLEGSAHVDVEDLRVFLPQHHAMVIAPGKYHCPSPSEGAFERFSFSFSVTGGSLLRSLREAVSDYRIFPATEELLTVCRDIFREFSSQEPYSHMMLHSLLTRMLVCVFRLLRIDSQPDAQDGVCRDIRLTHRIDSYFEEHLMVGAYVEDLAEQIHLSKSQLTRLLKEYYGMTFREKLLRTRMDRAAWLLKYTEKPIDEVAEAVGYRSESAFYQVFRKQFSVTPEKYRLQRKEARP